MANRYYTVSIKTKGGILAMYRSTKREAATEFKKALGGSAVITEVITTCVLPLGDLLKISLGAAA